MQGMDDDNQETERMEMTSVDDQDTDLTLPPATTPSEEGLTIRDAALRSGMTEKMIRVRIRNGSIESWKVQGKFGEEWRVRLPESMDNGAVESAPAPAAVQSAPAYVQPPPVPQAPAALTVPAELYIQLLERHEELSIRFGHLEAEVELAKETPPTPAPVPETPASTNEALEKIRNIARREAEARTRAEAEAVELRNQLVIAEKTIEELRKMVKILGIG